MTSNSMPMCSCSYSRKSFANCFHGLTSWMVKYCEEWLGQRYWLASQQHQLLLHGCLGTSHPPLTLPWLLAMSARPTVPTHQAYFAYKPCLPCLLCLHTRLTMLKHQATMFTMSVTPLVLSGLSMTWQQHITMCTSKSLIYDKVTLRCRQRRRPISC